MDKKIIARELLGLAKELVAGGEPETIRDLIDLARRERWMKSMGHHEEMLRQFKNNPQYRKIVLDADKGEDELKDPTDRKWFSYMREISERMRD